MGTALTQYESDPGSYADDYDPFNPPKKVGGQTYAPTPAPTQPLTPPTLPFATAGQGAPSGASATPNPTASQGLSPTTPHPLATSDPLAFAPVAGSTLPISTTPSTVGGAPGMAPGGASDLTASPSTAPINPALNVNGGAGSTPPVTYQPGQTYAAGQTFQGTPAGWVNSDPVAQPQYSAADPTIGRGPQFEQQSTLGDWAKAHSFGSTQGNTDPVQIANQYLAAERDAANGSLPNQGTGFNATLDALAKQTIADANAQYDASKTSGGFNPGSSPNQLPLTQMPGGTFQNQNGTPASQGGNPTSINNPATGGQTPVDTTPTMKPLLNPSQPTITSSGAGGGSTLPLPGAGGGTSSVPPGAAGASTPYSGPAPLAPSSNPNDLTNKTLARDPSIDRFALAKQNLTDWNATTNPQYEADLRDANRYAFANGRGYSGIENNAIGNIASQRDTARRGEQNTLLNKALGDTISDQFGDLGIAQQQQGFQAGRSDTGFEQGLKTEQQKQAEQQQGFNQQIATKQIDNLLQNTKFGQQMSVQQLSDFENSTAFQQALQQFYAGQIGDPAAYFEQLAQQWAKPVGGGY